MQLAKLVQCIKRGCDGYFAYMFLPSSSLSGLLQVACSIIPEEHLLFRLLGRFGSLSFLLILGPRALFYTRVLPLPHNQLLNIHLLLKIEQLEDKNPLNAG